MHLHFFTLKRQLEFLKEKITGAIIQDSFTQTKNEWVVTVESRDSGASHLQFSCDAQYPFLIWIEKVHRRKNTTVVMKEVIGNRIESLEIMPGERVILFHLNNHALTLLLKFFTNHSNFYILDDSGFIINSFKNLKKLRGTRFELPDKKLHDPTQIDWNTFQFLVSQWQYDPLSDILRRSFSYMTRTVVKEILYRAKLSNSKLADELSEEQLIRCFTEMQKFFQECNTADPFVYMERGIPIRFSLGHLEHLLKTEKKRYTDLNSALRFFCLQSIQHKRLLQKKSQYVKLLDKRMAFLDRNLEHLLKEGNDKNRIEYFQRVGKLLLAQPHIIKPGKTRVQIVDYFDDKMPLLTVAVDANRSAQENAEYYFQKARQYTQNIKIRQQRKQNLSQKRRLLVRLKSQLETISTLTELQKIETVLKKHHLLQPAASEISRFRLPYKNFSLKKFQIWVGRTARDNDIMTFKLAHKEDWWLHVQGHVGSHVVIRNPGKLERPPSRVLEFAARLAVTFSAAKHANYVPVIYTKVKYVRKPRKSPPGTAVPSRVKSLFADPLPHTGKF